MGQNYQPEPHIEIIILTWNGKDDTLACLQTVRKLNYSNYDVIVVDNGSVDGSVDAMKSCYTDRSWLTVIENGENRGYAGGNNVGISYAMDHGADFVWILNNDTLLEPDSLTLLIQAATEDPKAGVLGPKVLSYPNTHLIYSRGESHSLWFNRRTIDVGEMDRKQEVLPRRVDYVVGCAMLVSRKFIERVGMLDETYFAYYEEIDWCFRGREAGFDILYVPASVIYHKGGASTGGIYSPTATYYRTRNWIYFMRKHAAFYHWFVFVPLFTFVFLRRFFAAAFRWDLKVIGALFRGVGWHFNRE